ncbi:MAG: S26 family signal peptidase, partial [Petrotogales bacterium]
IKNGDVLVILESDSPNFDTRIGDILVYLYNGDTLVAHRLYNENPSGYFLKGDANEQAEFVPKELVVGKIIGIAPQNPIGRWSVQYVAEN